LVISFHINAAIAGAVISGSNSSLRYVVDAGLPLQQQSDDQSQHQLDAERKMAV